MKQERILYMNRLKFPNGLKKGLKKKKKSTVLQQSQGRFEGTEGKIIEATLARDLFDSILCLSMQ